MPPDSRTPARLAEPSESMEKIYEQVRALGRENERILGDLIAGESRFRRLAKAVWQVQEDERRRLARELHDGIGQTLTALKNHLQWLDLPADTAAAAGLAEAVELASQALEDTRELSRLLRPPVLDDLGLVAALKWLGRTVSKRFRLEIAVTAEEQEERFSAEVETVLFRIAQEALTNAAKHAEAGEVSIRLTRSTSEVVLRVADNGTGFDVARAAPADDHTGVGLRGMKDRVELFEGTLDLRSRPGEGTEVTARLPVTGKQYT